MPQVLALVSFVESMRTTQLRTTPTTGIRTDRQQGRPKHS
jgi:hypothetical protein